MAAWCFQKQDRILPVIQPLIHRCTAKVQAQFWYRWYSNRRGPVSQSRISQVYFFPGLYMQEPERSQHYRYQKKYFLHESVEEIVKILLGIVGGFGKIRRPGLRKIYLHIGLGDGFLQFIHKIRAGVHKCSFVVKGLYSNTGLLDFWKDKILQSHS